MNIQERREIKWIVTIDWVWSRWRLEVVSNRAHPSASSLTTTYSRPFSYLGPHQAVWLRSLHGPEEGSSHRVLQLPLGFKRRWGGKRQEVCLVYLVLSYLIVSDFSSKMLCSERYHYGTGGSARIFSVCLFSDMLALSSLFSKVIFLLVTSPKHLFLFTQIRLQSCSTHSQAVVR